MCSTLYDLAYKGIEMIKYDIFLIIIYSKNNYLRIKYILYNKKL